jgi:hypothetical protein
MKENKWFEDDKEELKHAISSLKLKGYVGIANKCNQCNHQGGFGAIMNYESETGNKYIICGWCGYIEKRKQS